VQQLNFMLQSKRVTRWRSYCAHSVTTSVAGDNYTRSDWLLQLNGCRCRHRHCCAMLGTCEPVNYRLLAYLESIRRHCEFMDVLVMTEWTVQFFSNVSDHTSCAWLSRRCTKLQSTTHRDGRGMSQMTQVLLFIHLCVISVVFIANSKSTMNFLTCYGWRAYVTPKSSKGLLKKRICHFFVNKTQLMSNKVWHKVYLCKNFQQQSCIISLPLFNGLYMLAVNVNLQPNI